MKILSKVVLISICLFLLGVLWIGSPKEVWSSEDEIITISDDITDNLTLQENSKVFFKGDIDIKNGKTLTIEKGVEITFKGSSSLNVVDGSIIANGEINKKIIFKKENEDATYGIFFGSRNYQSSFKYVSIVEGGSEAHYQSRSILNNFLIKSAYAQFYPNEFGSPAIILEGGKLHMENSEFVDSPFQDIEAYPMYYYNDPDLDDDIDGTYEIYLSELEMINSNFSSDRALSSEQCDEYRDMYNLPANTDMDWCKEKVYLKNNYYGDEDGPNIDINGKEEDPSKGFYLKGDFKLDGFSSIKFVLESDISGASNVLFLPGIKASYLYKYDSDNDLDELWLPNWFGNDIEELELDNEGVSKEKVFVRDGDVMKSTIAGNIYKSFIDDLDELKNNQIINDYEAFAYDWRQNVEDIVKNGTPYENNQTRSVISEINNLAQNSKTGKVTIVAHSNGGLVAKAVMVDNPELAEKIDKIILVATPQMGTPLTTLSMLYGYEESLPTLLSQEKARKLIEDMPGVYGLLPSGEYFSRNEKAIINFSSEKNSERGEMFYDAYGDDISDLEEFRNFLLSNNDDRKKPDDDEIELENILNEKLLDEAINTHNNLDNWIPPENVKVIQLAGWGLPTVSRINYVEKKESECIESYFFLYPICHDTDKYELIPEPKFTSDGDAVVTAPSGLMISTAENVERYWFDLYSYDTPTTIGRKHKDILEANSIREFLKNEIQDSETTLPEYIGADKPDDYQNMEPRIQMSLYSPLDIHLYDSNGNHTGYKEIQTNEGTQRIIEENIPNSYYLQLGERKYVGFEKGEDVKVRLDGYGEGAYTLKVEEIRDTENGEEIIKHVTFKNLPTSESTKVELNIPASGLESISSLKADYDGDGDNDYVLESILDEEVTLPDVTPPKIEITSPESRIYRKNEMLDVGYLVSDDRSSLDKIKIEKFLDNQVIDQNNLDLSLLSTGEHKLIIKATDEASNAGEEDVIFNIKTDIKILKENINHFYDLKLIKTNQERKMLNNNLSVIEREIDFYNNIKNNIFIKGKVKNILLRVLKNQIENHIDIVIKKIEQDKKNYVTIIKEVIVSDLEFIKNSIK